MAHNFTVANVGTVKAKVTIGQPITNANLVIPPGQTPDLGQLKVAVHGYLPSTPITGLPQQIDLGELDGGKQATYTVFVSLDAAAGNEWQNVTASGEPTVTLIQKV